MVSYGYKVSVRSDLEIFYGGVLSARQVVAMYEEKTKNARKLTLHKNTRRIHQKSKHSILNYSKQDGER